ncbi:sensor histidine kinase [Actinoplanes friuliensis]|uniref:histidine kinase n=1 Tax=Actinoplanes friuliensis DSM 7358 TaxID=1246995 RepID=U5VNZ1_9ACTN|nr:HAMP domain-containing sensor histidine kinase [Actinoplanes friuliensis]AGZ38509.1 Osmosensitive K+ channel histidine kinase KdpD [Actinoplanes friuliensis DSM 7358]
MRWQPGLKARLALMSATAVALAIAVVSVLAWWATDRTMRSEIDRTLTNSPLSARFEQRGSFDVQDLCTIGPTFGAILQRGIGAVQVVRADGTSCAVAQEAAIPVTREDIAVAAGGEATAPRDAETTTGTHVRAITFPLRDGYAITVWRDLTELDNTVRTLFLALLISGGLGVLGALCAGLVVARAGLRPLDNLTDAAEHVAATQNLNVPIAVTGTDEVARLALAFNRMTSALEGARQRHNQTIADASHELRTPLTSLRTNIELLVRSEDQQRALAPGDRRDLLRSLSGQLQELTHLTSELSLLAHQEPAVEQVPVAVDEVVRRAVQRASRRGHHTITTDLQPWTVRGDPAALERAVLNLLDNAVKFSPPKSAVAVRLRQGLLEVEDQGPGIPESEHRQVFQRFWRSPSARALPGSGLGLAIVADVAETHGAQVGVTASATGGAIVSIRLPPFNALSGDAGRGDTPAHAV